MESVPGCRDTRCRVKTGLPIVSPECRSRTVRCLPALVPRPSPFHRGKTPSARLFPTINVSNRPEMPKPGRPVQRFIVEPLYWCRRSVALSAFLIASAQWCIWGLQACGLHLWLSLSRHAASNMFPLRLEVLYIYKELQSDSTKSL